MSRELCIDIIAFYLSQIDALLSIKGPNHLFDTNTHLEQTYCGLLNRVYGWKLTNQNIVKLNEANIDLAGPHEDTPTTGKKMSVQISSTATAKKTRKTLTGFFDKKMDDTYDRLYMVFASTSAPTVTDYSANIPRPFNFDPAVHIINHTTLFTKINQMEDAAKIAEIAHYLQLEVGQNPFVPKVPLLQLPAPDERSRFFIENSRDQLIDDLLPNLTPNNPIFICGPGGIGKTQVAQELARKYKFENGPFCIKYRPSEYPKEDALVASILSTPFGGVICRETDPDKRKAAYQDRKNYIQSSLKGAVFVVDDFHLFGLNIDDLRREQAYRDDLTRLGICLIITTRFCSNRQFGVHVTKLPEEMLTDQIRKHCDNDSLEDHWLKALVNLVECNSMMIFLIAETISKGFLDPKDLYDAMYTGDFSGLNLPMVTDGRTGCVATIRDHMNKLYDITKLDEDSLQVLAIAVPVEDRQIDGNLFFTALPEHLQPKFNSLLDGSWFCRNSGLIKIYPVARLVCRDQITPSPDMLRVFLANLEKRFSNGKISSCQSAHIMQYFASAQKFFNGDPELQCLYRKIIS